jgi:hypothetical protein
VAEFVVPVKRKATTARAVGCVAYAVIGLAVPYWRPTLYGYALGAVTVGLFGIQVYWWVRILRSPGLRIADDGFGFGGWNWSWADVDGFEARGKFASSTSVTMIKIVLDAGAAKSFETKAAEVLGGLHFLGPPAYILTPAFEAEGKDILDALKAWHSRFGAPSP